MCRDHRQDREPERRVERPHTYYTTHDTLHKMHGEYDRREAVGGMFRLFDALLLRNGRDAVRDPYEVQEEGQHRRDRRAMIEERQRAYFERPRVRPRPIIL